MGSLDSVERVYGPHSEWHRHVGFFTDMKAARVKAIRAFIKSDKRNAAFVAGMTLGGKFQPVAKVRGSIPTTFRPVQSTVTDQRGRVFTMTALEEQYHTDTFRLNMRAFETGRSIHWPTAPVLKLADIVALKREARAVVTEARKAESRKAQTSDRKVAGAVTADDLAAWDKALAPTPEAGGESF
jgi:hypothetical protein